MGRSGAWTRPAAHFQSSVSLHGFTLLSLSERTTFDHLILDRHKDEIFTVPFSVPTDRAEGTCSSRGIGQGCARSRPDFRAKGMSRIVRRRRRATKAGSKKR